MFESLANSVGCNSIINCGVTTMYPYSKHVCICVCMCMCVVYDNVSCSNAWVMTTLLSAVYAVYDTVSRSNAYSGS